MEHVPFLPNSVKTAWKSKFGFTDSPTCGEPQLLKTFCKEFLPCAPTHILHIWNQMFLSVEISISM